MMVVGIISQKKNFQELNESSNINFGYGYCFLDNDTIEKK